jgi:regulator of sigma E protease
MLSGPIGVGATFVDIVKIWAGWKILVFIIAILSVNLGVLNILPFPALDGWRIVTTTLYSLVVRFFGKSEKLFLTAEKYFHGMWFLLLLILMLYVAGLDISRLFS